MSAPLVTALVRTFQSAATLPTAVASVLAQTEGDLECLIVDDGSSDETRTLVAGFTDPRIRYVRHEKNLGRAAARKTGLAEARGRFIGLLDADDWWYPKKLERQLSILDAEPQLPVVSCGMLLFDSKGGPVGVEGANPTPELVRHPPMRSPGPCPFPNPACLFRAEFVRERRIDVTLPRSEDFDFILPILLRYPSALWAEPLYAYLVPEAVRHRVHAESAAAARRVYAKYARSYPFSSLFRQGECLAKQAVYAIWARTSKAPRALRRSARPLAAWEASTFEQERATVLAALAQL